jgi:hypothetical protein
MRLHPRKFSKRGNNANANVRCREFRFVVASHIWRARAQRLPILLSAALGDEVSSDF